MERIIEEESLENTEYYNLNSYINELRIKLWKEGKIKLEGYSYLEWVNK